MNTIGSGIAASIGGKQQSLAGTQWGLGGGAGGLNPGMSSSLASILGKDIAEPLFSKHEAARLWIAITLLQSDMELGADDVVKISRKLADSLMDEAEIIERPSEEERVGAYEIKIPDGMPVEKRQEISVQISKYGNVSNYTDGEKRALYFTPADAVREEKAVDWLDSMNIEYECP